MITEWLLEAAHGVEHSLLLDVTKIGKWSHAKAVLVNMLKDA